MLSRLKNLADAICVLFTHRTYVKVDSSTSVSVLFFHCSSAVHLRYIKNRQKNGILITISFEKGFKRFFVDSDNLDVLEDNCYKTSLYDGLLFSTIDPSNVICFLTQYCKPLNSYMRS